MRLLPRLRLLLARRPWLYWLAVAMCAAVVWLAMSSAAASVQHERASWGTTRQVWVTNAAFAPGEPIAASAVEYPLAMVPPDAVDAAPTGEAAHSLAAGEVVVASDVAGERGLLPAGWLVFAVPADGSPALVTGDTAAVFGSGQRWCDGLVLAVGEVGLGGGAMIEVGVAPDCAAALSAQLALGAVTLARA